MKRTRVSLLSLIAAGLKALCDALRPGEERIDSPAKGKPAGSRSA